MQSKGKYLVVFIIIAIMTIVAIILGTHTYSKNKTEEIANKIQVGDNLDIEDTPMEEVEQKIIHFDDEIGVLTIPDILLENAPIRESVELETLRETIGHFPSTSLYEGNVGLASHNSGGRGDFFKNLKNIKIGSEIFYQTKFGTKRYVVQTKQIISDDDWSFLQNTDDNRITMITCHKGQPDKRLCVQAVESNDGMDYGQ